MKDCFSQVTECPFDLCDQESLTVSSYTLIMQETVKSRWAKSCRIQTNACMTICERQSLRIVWVIHKIVSVTPRLIPILSKKLWVG